MTVDDSERGSAVVEFIGTTVVLLIPLVYLVLTVGRLQAGAFAVDGAAREAARAVVTAVSSDDAAARARVAAGIALEDQGFDPQPALTGGAVQVTCAADPCLSPGGTVTATVHTRVPLPFVPEALRSWVPLEVPVESRYRASVDQFREVR
ncbi:pilus assembly protein [Xylanimonas allomyrinae]|uniref:Pilus assembly protein n=1 Tax=Xylanimonas allomyrinae TaxID=2509459 RepID=A0A4P6EID9_9MICO|nr:pilus assembly protein [Xylanimonas allomyrinae]QAY62065.1 pilus assembly protein [Xylanimonas allomyrinae]